MKTPQTHPNVMKRTEGIETRISRVPNTPLWLILGKSQHQLTNAMEATVKTLGESYEGSLSRDWEKLMAILEAGSDRIVVATDMKTGSQYGMNIREEWMGGDSYWLREYLENCCIGWFPTKEDEL